MSIQQDSFIVSIADKAEIANSAAKQTKTDSSNQKSDVLCIVTSVTGYYHNLLEIKTNGTTGQSYEHILSQDCSVFQEGDRVNLYWDGLSPIPKIRIGSSGGGGGSSSEYVPVIVSRLGFNG
jgi:hypothetical protein